MSLGFIKNLNSGKKFQKGYSPSLTWGIKKLPLSKMNFNISIQLNDFLGKFISNYLEGEIINTRNNNGVKTFIYF